MPLCNVAQFGSDPAYSSFRRQKAQAKNRTIEERQIKKAQAQGGRWAAVEERKLARR